VRWVWQDAEVGEWGGMLRLLGTRIAADVLSCDDRTILLWEDDDRVFHVECAAEA
jgi:hypothetical protein